MCTVISKCIDRLYFGRNMDIEKGFGEEMVFVPRNFPLSFKAERTVEHHNAFMGIGAVMDGYPMMAEGVNEHGLCMAGLNFVGNAFYGDIKDGKENVAPYELIPLILSTCKSVREAKRRLEYISLISVPFKENVPLPTLHFYIADQHGALVFEAMKNGNHIYDNFVGALTNNPPFSAQMDSLANYENLTNQPRIGAFSLGKPYSLGLSSYGLPGDFSSSSRFVRAVYLKHFSVWEKGEEVSQMLHLLDSVAVPKGAVINGSGEYHYTLYQSCIDTSECIYYFRTYGSINTHLVRMDHFNADSDKIQTVDIYK